MKDLEYRSYGEWMKELSSWLRGDLTTLYISLKEDCAEGGQPLLQVTVIGQVGTISSCARLDIRKNFP